MPAAAPTIRDAQVPVLFEIYGLGAAAVFLVFVGLLIGVAEFGIGSYGGRERRRLRGRAGTSPA